ncbi:MAG: hypothetical protein ACLQRH_13225 [Acidimicrobiales bacterium]|jgi:hypothetical protein
MRWQWTIEPELGVLADDSGMVQRIVVVREPMIGENAIGHVIVQGLGLADTWFETVEEARHYAEGTLTDAVGATLVPSEGQIPDENLIWITPVWPGQGYPGTAPDEWEHEFHLPSGEVLAGVKKVGESVQVPDGTRLRYRFRWGGRSGVWNDEGVAAYPPG